MIWPARRRRCRRRASSSTWRRSGISSTGSSPARSPHNPAASVRGPSHTAKKGKTPVLDATEARQLLDSIDVTTPAGLRDRALIALMVFSFARIGAALAMRVDDIYVQRQRLWVRLREKGGKRHEMPCHHTLEAFLHAYLDGTGIGDDPKGPLFRTIRRGTGQLSDTPLPQANAYAMVRRRALAAGIGTAIGNHTFRATGITTYLKNGGTLENAAAMANHERERWGHLRGVRSNVSDRTHLRPSRLPEAVTHEGVSTKNIRACWASRRSTLIGAYLSEL
jgi:integrase